MNTLGQKEEEKEKYRKAVPKWERYVHLIYFAFVALHGPYHYVAAVCFFLGVLVLVLHVNGD